MHHIRIVAIHLSLVASVLAGPARGHDLFLEWKDDGLRLMVGHVAVWDDHDEPAHALPDSLLSDAWALTVDGAVPLEVGPQPLPCPPDAVGAVVRVDWGPRAATRDGSVPLASARPDDILATSHARATAAVLRGAMPPSLGIPDLVLMPLGDPTALKAGGKVRLRVLRDGVPCPGATVLVDGSPRGETGRDGELNVRIRRGGWQQLQAVWRGPDPTGTVDRLVLETSLVFDCQE